jgi:glycosyltransferase involved in cell wall biosynthesis
MKILVIHNRYQHRGGEDSVVDAEIQLLSAAGHEVVCYQRHNHQLEITNSITAAFAGIGTIWASTSYKAISELLAREKPDLAHFHNTFPLISPSGYYACRQYGIPVVQTLHNYRLLCPQATFFREGRACEDCLHRRVPWPAVKGACYRDSRLATSAVCAMLLVHRLLNTWTEKVNLYIALSEFSRGKFIEGGLPSQTICVKPNFVSDLGPRSENGGYAVYVGRLSPEKGPELLQRAWKNGNISVPLKILGDGPLRPTLEAKSEQLHLTHITFEGWVERSRALEFIKRALFLIFPSTCYENFPVAIAEAYSCGVPVIASRLGAIAEIVRDRVTGILFEPGNAEDLAAKVEWAWSHPGELRQMGKAARAEYEGKYTPERNYEILMRIYQKAIHGN